jgi:LPS-assembly lipoprotein
MSSSELTPCGPAGRVEARRRGLLLLLAAPLAGCGFKLRGAEPLAFQRIALTGFAPRSPLAQALQAALLDRGVTVEANPARAQLVLQALADARERSVVATTSAAQVRELQLRLRLRWRTHTPQGREVTPPAELVLARDMSYSESQALAKQHEEADFYREMQADIVAQVMRRLAAVRL